MPLGILKLKSKKSKEGSGLPGSKDAADSTTFEPKKITLQAPVIIEKDEEIDSINDSEEADENFEEIPMDHSRLRTRESVSAEAYGAWNTRRLFVPPIYEKTPEQESAIHKAVSESFLFAELDPFQLSTVIKAFHEVEGSPQQILIKEGDDGDKLYLIEEGTVKVYKQFGPTGKPQHLCELTSGDIFGELALMYNAPRAATVEAITEVKMWALDRETFNNIVRDATIQKRETYEKFLKDVELLKDMEDYERSKIADCLKEHHFEKNQYIIREGDIGDCFYILIEGTAIAVKEDQIVMEYDKGGYFGELSLLKNQPRAASIKATSECRVVSLNRKSFKRMLGPLENILIRNVEKYKKTISSFGLNVSYLDL